MPKSVLEYDHSAGIVSVPAKQRKVIRAATEDMRHAVSHTNALTLAAQEGSDHCDKVLEDSLNLEGNVEHHKASHKSSGAKKKPNDYDIGGVNEAKPTDETNSDHTLPLHLITEECLVHIASDDSKDVNSMDYTILANGIELLPGTEIKSGEQEYLR